MLINQLCKVLPMDEMKQEKWVVLATSSGGVPIALLLAKDLNAQFEFFIYPESFYP